MISHSHPEIQYHIVFNYTNTLPGKTIKCDIICQEGDHTYSECDLVHAYMNTIPSLATASQHSIVLNWDGRPEYMSLGTDDVSFKTNPAFCSLPFRATVLNTFVEDNYIRKVSNKGSFITFWLTYNDGVPITLAPADTNWEFHIIIRFK